MEKKDFSKFRTVTPLDEGILEEVSGGSGNGEYKAPHCPCCRTYDVRVIDGRGYCAKCLCDWRLKDFHQAPELKEVYEGCIEEVSKNISDIF